MRNFQKKFLVPSSYLKKDDHILYANHEYIFQEYIDSNDVNYRVKVLRLSDNQEIIKKILKSSKIQVLNDKEGVVYTP